MGELLILKDVIKNYSSKLETLTILKGVNLSVNQCDKILITGESGSGKSTLLNLIGALDKPTSGNIFFKDRDITKMEDEELTVFRNKEIGFIFQDHYLLEEFTALENVMLPSLIKKFDIKKAKEKAEKLLKYMEMQNRLSHYPSELSGGEKQRVAIARAFVNNPELILADEPTGNLDEKNASIVLEMLFDVTKKESHTLIIVSHSSNILKLAQKSYQLENGMLSEIV